MSTAKGAGGGKGMKLSEIIRKNQPSIESIAEGVEILEDLLGVGKLVTARLRAEKAEFAKILGSKYPTTRSLVPDLVRALKSKADGGDQ